MTPPFFLSLIAQYRYIILAPAALIGGLLVDMLVGVAIRLHLLEFLPAYLSIMTGELFGDVVWYGIGYHWGESFMHRFGKYVGISESNVATVQDLFRHYSQRILFSSKLTSGFGLAIPILFTAGMSRVSFWKYMRANLTGQFIWSCGLIAVGYYFGDLYLRVDTTFQKISLIALAMLAIFAVIGFARYLRGRMTHRSS